MSLDLDKSQKSAVVILIVGIIVSQSLNFSKAFLNAQQIIDNKETLDLLTMIGAFIAIAGVFILIRKRT